MQDFAFIQSLAVAMLAAGAVAVLFRSFRQPVVLGYLIAGVLIGPHVSPWPLINNSDAIHTLSDLGVLFLMFSLGMDFNLPKLTRVALPAIVVAAFEIVTMIWVGLQLGLLLGFTAPERLLFGIILALTSTMIVVKTLRDSNALGEKHGEIITGVCIIEDIFVVVAMILLPKTGWKADMAAGPLFLYVSQLVVAGIAVAILGLLLIPRMLNKIGRTHGDELTLLVTLGIGFGMALASSLAGYGVALGAFLAGAIVAESRHRGKIERMVAPMRNLFGALFFVAVGMMVDPAHLTSHIGTVLIVTAVYTVAKAASCAFGTFMTGNDATTAARVGTSMTQLGEFGFILASMGIVAGVATPRLETIIVAVASLNALFRPYLVDNADKIAARVRAVVPRIVIHIAELYAGWISHLRDLHQQNVEAKIVRNLVIQIAINAALIAASFLAAAVIEPWLPENLFLLPEFWGGNRVVLWFCAFLIVLPVYIVTIRKLEALGMMIAEQTIPPGMTHNRTELIRTLLARIIHGGGIVGLALMTLLIGSPLLPPMHTLMFMLAVVAGLLLFFRSTFNAWYSRAKFSLLDTWTRPPARAPRRKTSSTFPSGTTMGDVIVQHSSVAGCLIRELKLPERFGVAIVAIDRSGKTLINLGPDDEIQAGDRLILLGPSDQLSVAGKAIQNGSL